MKKTIRLLTSVIILSGCVDTTAQLQAQQEEQERQIEIRNKEIAQQLDALLTEKKDLFLTVHAYNLFFLHETEENDSVINSVLKEGETWNYSTDTIYCSEKPVFSNYNSYHIVKTLSKYPNGVKLECFGESDLYDTDECVLQRREHKLDTMCWFNYSKYLPENTIVKNANFFMSMKSVVSEMESRMHNCRVMKDTTSQEREDCVEESRKFAYDVLFGKAKHCRDSHKKEWESMLTYNIENNENALSYLDEIMADEKNKKMPTKAEQDIHNFYASLLQLQMAQNAFDNFAKNVSDFGYKNLCVVTGWGDDVQKLKKKTSTKKQPKSKIGSVISLN